MFKHNINEEAHCSNHNHYSSISQQQTKSKSLWNLGKVSISVISSIDEEDEEEVFTSRHPLLLSGEHVLKKARCCRYWGNFWKHCKVGCLVVIWAVCSITLMLKNETVHSNHLISIPSNYTKGYIIPEPVISDDVLIKLEGAFLPQYYANLSEHHMEVWVQLIKTSFSPVNVSNLRPSDILSVTNISDIWKIPIVSRKLIGTVPEVSHKKVYQLYNTSRQNYSHYFLKVKLKTNVNANFPVSMTYNVQPINENYGLLYAALLLVLLYILMIFELVHRSLAAMVVSSLALAVLAAHNDRPTMAEIFSWIDVETLLLLFSMMTMVSIFTETGIFDYLSVLAFKITKGKVWPLITTLCFFTALFSCFLDNVTTALLMTPVTIRLCEVLKLNPVPVLINMVMYSNIGGALTPIGDPPNVIIASNPAVIAAGVNFMTFTLHMFIGVFLSCIVAYVQLKYIYRDPATLKFQERPEVQDLRREIAVWKRAAASMSSYSREEDAVKDSLKKRTSRLMEKLQTTSSHKEMNERCAFNVKDLEEQYPIRDKPLLVKCCVTLLLVITVFVVQTVPGFCKLSMGWTALLGAILILILAEKDDMEAILARVEWSSLLFFACLFILMEVLSRLGLIDWIGNQTHALVMMVGQDARLTVAILLMLWISGIASAFVDNIPLTTMMIRIATNLSSNEELSLPMQPLIWALSFGACLGGNGTLFGSSSNIICAGVAEQHGYRFTFMEFMRVGFPITLSTLLVTTGYLLVAHIVFAWH